MKSLLTDLWLQCIQDIGCMGSYPGTTRDKLACLSRVEDEGESFLTLTLPSFLRDFERSLEEGKIDSTAFRSFRKAGSIPAFLQGMTSRVFDSHGVLLQSPDVKAIAHIRQLTGMFKKLKADCTPKRVQKALDAYVEVERDMAQLHVSKRDLSLFSQVADRLWSNFEINPFEIRPKFGPGVTADRLSHSARREWPIWHSRLDESFPFYGTALSVGSIGMDSTQLVAEDQEKPVRVILVPKTLKAPRVIAAEPACMQFCQQGILDHLESKLRRYYPSYLNLRDQTRNQSMARDCSNATLDLSEASDRCHGALVWLMLRSCPSLRKALFDARSTQAELPDGTIIPLQKFASMGSATCFPIETMVFFTIVVVGMLRSRPVRDTNALLKEVIGRCSVYGDDIIVPVDYASDVAQKLEAFGLRVNRDKSFWTGKFRESCGKDYYDGTDVSLLYCRSNPASCDPETIVSLASLANKFYQRGYLDTAELLARWLKPHGLFRVPDDRFVGLTFSGKEKTRFNKRLQRREFATHVPVARTKSINIDGIYGLSDWFHRSERSSDTSLMQERSKGTPLKIKRVWTYAT